MFLEREILVRFARNTANLTENGYTKFNYLWKINKNFLFNKIRFFDKNNLSTVSDINQTGELTTAQPVNGDETTLANDFFDDFTTAVNEIFQAGSDSEEILPFRERKAELGLLIGLIILVFGLILAYIVCASTR